MKIKVSWNGTVKEYCFPTSVSSSNFDIEAVHEQSYDSFSCTIEEINPNNFCRGSGGTVITTCQNRIFSRNVQVKEDFSKHNNSLPHWNIYVNTYDVDVKRRNKHEIPFHNIPITHNIKVILENDSGKVLIEKEFHSIAKSII